MFNWLKREKKEEALPEDKTGYLERLRQGLNKTREGLANLFLGKKQIDADLLDELETLLLTADVGIEATNRLIQVVQDKISRKELDDAEAVRQALAQEMEALLSPLVQEIEMEKKPHVILMVGINGAGKTTSIGKLAHHYLEQNKKVMLAAGDTFRAAAVEQLQTWGERNGVPVIAQGTGADSASVAYDAVQSAMAKGVDVLIIDTAGRLHTQNHLMEELKKIKRVIQKINPEAPHETLLVIDAGNGQNALKQAQHFNEALDLSGIILTKLDGTAKGGIIFAIAEKIKLPIRFIGVGEGKTDLRPFNPSAFIRALLYND